MPKRLLGGFGRNQSPGPDAVRGPGRRNPPTTQGAAALDLAQEILRGLEHFVLASPDLDTPGFLQRLRRAGQRLTPHVEEGELELQRHWASGPVCEFGQQQRRYLTEREDELWKLLEVYQEHQKLEGAANKQFHDALAGAHERLSGVLRLNDLRQLRERVENEIRRASVLVDEKVRADAGRAEKLSRQVQALEAALVAARRDAARDPLTGIYNRAAFQEQLGAALTSPQRCALAMVDVDDFKNINDTLGHLAGDEVLRQSVQLISRAARPGDVLARFGGDEFCLLSPGTDARHLHARFEDLVARRNVEIQQEERPVTIRLSLSAGVATSITGDTPESLIDRADHTMYQAKRSGKARALLCEDGLLRL
jgi:diguanylate cyclase (GGDEF)-like protein